MVTRMTLSIAAAAVGVAILGVVAGRLLFAAGHGYSRMVRHHYQEERRGVPEGECARIHCRRPAIVDGYCSAEHEIDDAYHAAGY